jgi:hypothetical protein
MRGRKKYNSRTAFVPLCFSQTERHKKKVGNTKTVFLLDRQTRNNYLFYRFRKLCTLPSSNNV